MVRKVQLKNLICTGCAERIEKALTRLSYINSANFSFVNQTMLLETTEDYEETQALEDIQNIVDGIETGIEVLPYGERHRIEPRKFIKSYRFVIVGALIYAIGAIFGHLEILRPRLNLLYWIGYGFVAHKVIHNTYLSIRRGEIFNENTLMFVATLAAMFIEKPYEAALVIFFYSIGEHLQHRAVDQSKNEISSLMDLHVDYANIKEGDDVVIRDPMNVKAGDILIVKQGEKIPVDGTIVKGRTSLNTSALTGESKLQSAGEGERVLSGKINLGEVIEIKAEKEYSDSTIARIIDLVENATNTKTRTENFITRFARYYTPTVTGLALLLALVPSLLNPAMTEDYIFRAAIFLVISCPCALVLSIPLSYFAGIGASAKEGILFKGSNFLDSLHLVDTIGIDKTGTLTHGTFEVAGYTNYRTLELAASLERYSNHPIAQSVVEAYEGTFVDFERIEELPGLGIKGIHADKEVLVGGSELLRRHGIEAGPRSDAAANHIFVAEDGRYLGRLLIKDRIRESSKDVIRNLKRRARITMLTGDNETTASEVALEVGGIDYAHSLMPEDKIEVFEQLAAKGKTLYIGDGINDAPLIRRADIGIAMGEGSELALDVADVIIMESDLTRLRTAFEISGRTRRIVFQNIALSLGVKFTFLALASVGATTMLMAIFADVGITLIAVLNALRLIYGRGRKNHEEAVI